MHFTGQIDYVRTCATNRLVLRHRWSALVETIVIVLFCFSFLGTVVMAYLVLDTSRPNEQFLAFGILPVAGLLALFLLYKKLIERRLMVVPTGLSREETRRKVQEAVAAWHWKVWVDHADYLQATTTSHHLEAGHAVTVLFEDGALRLNVLSETRGGRLPVAFSDYLYRYDFKKLFAPFDGNVRGLNAKSG